MTQKTSLPWAPALPERMSTRKITEISIFFQIYWYALYYALRLRCIIWTRFVGLELFDNNPCMQFSLVTTTPPSVENVVMHARFRRSHTTDSTNDVIVTLLALLYYRARKIAQKNQQKVNYGLTTLHAHTYCMYVLRRCLHPCTPQKVLIWLRRCITHPTDAIRDRTLLTQQQIMQCKCVSNHA